MWLKLIAPIVLAALMMSMFAVGEGPPKHSAEVNKTTRAPPLTLTKNINVPTGKSVFDLPTDIDEDELLHEVSLFMQSIMNQKVEPCEDFYEYACGNWKNSERVPLDGRKNSLLYTIQSKINNLIVDFLKNTTAIDPKSGEGKAKVFYSSCLTGGKDISVGLKTILDNEKTVAEKVKFTGKDDWILVNFMSPYNVYPLLPLSVNYSTHTRQFEVSINEPIPVLGNFPNVSVPEEMSKTFGPVASELKVMLEFERNLTSKVQVCNYTERTTLNDFMTTHKNDPIDWKQVFKEAFGDKMSADWKVNNRISNFTDLERFLRKSNTENLKNYVKWRTIVKFYNIWKDELPEDEKREQICRQHTENYFTYALIPWFVEHLYDVERREDTLHLANSIQNSFLNMTAHYNWLDDDTRSHITSKLQAMDIYVGFKDEMRHRQLIDEVYGDVEITTDWFKNLQVLEENHARTRLSSVHKTVLPPMLSPYSVNAYYADYINSAFVTMGISQMPLYHIRLPKSLKFGGLGMLISHEMSHSLDNKAYHMDYDGKHFEWPSETFRHFQEKTECLENQYNKFIFRGIQTNGSMTMADNIADNAGARLSYNSYMESMGYVEGMEKPLPDSNFTNNELFFIKLAQSWCTGREDSYKIRSMKSDIHAYAEYRVLGPLCNMNEFADTFQCKLGSQMNPLKKCVVW